MSKPKSKYFIDNKAFHASLKSWLDCEEPGRMPEFVGECIMKIAYGFANRWNWIRYTDVWKEHMIGEAVEHMVRYAGNYDFDKYSNPHGYFSMICDHAFKNTVKREKRNHAAKLSATIDVITDLNNSEDMEYTIPNEMYFDLLGKLRSYTGEDAGKPEGRKGRLSKSQKASESAVDMTDLL